MSRIIVKFVPNIGGEAQAFAEEFQSAPDIDDVTFQPHPEKHLGVESALAILILGSGGLALLTRIIDWLRDRNDCLLVIDARGDDLQIEERCDVQGRRGQVIIVAHSNERVAIKRHQAVLDLQAIVTEALGKSATAAAELARASGATAEVESSGRDL